MMAYSDISECVHGDWPDPQPATMSPAERAPLSPRRILDSGTGNRFHQRGSVAEHALSTAVKRVSPRAVICIAQPRPERRGQDMVADIRADIEIRYSQDTGPGMVSDVTAINTLFESRVRDYRFKPDSKPDTDGPAAALRHAETTKVRMYGGAY